MPLPLADIKIVDLTHAAAGPYGAMILGDLGADVIKIEPLKAEEHTRSWGTKVGEESTYDLSLNRNKRSVALNLKSEAALQVIYDMVSRCDVFLENFRPGVADRMGLSFETLKAINPRIVYGSVSGFGRIGPRAQEPGFDIVAQALAGVMSINGTHDGDPLRVGLPLGDLGAGMWLALAVTAALRQRDLTGEGQRVETSLLATMLGLLTYHTQSYLTAGMVPTRTGNQHSGIAPYGVFQAQDQLLAIAPAGLSMWPKVCRTLGLDELIDDEAYAEPQKRLQNAAPLKIAMEQALQSDTAESWARKLVAAGVPAAPVNDVGMGLEDPQVHAAGLIETIDHPSLGEWRSVASPMTLSMANGVASTRRPPPRPGEHSIECLRELGISPEVIQALIDKGDLRQT